jgi:signal transduction histidine kinase
MEGEMARQERAYEVLELILDSVADGVVVCDGDGRVTLSNRAAERMTGIGATGAAPAEWQRTFGLFRRDKLTPFPAEEIPLVRALRGEATDAVPMFLRKPEVTAGIHLSVSGRPLRDDGGAICGAVVVFREVTREVELDRFREDITALLVHDLKNPMAVILAGVDQAERSLRRGSPDEVLDLLHECRLSARRAVRLASTMLQVARLEASRVELKKHRFELRDLVARLIEHDTPRIRGEGIAVAVDVHDGLDLDADEELLARVIENLLDNAIRHTPRGGRIALRGRRRGGAVELRVGNSGPPVPSAHREAVFDKFHMVEPTTDGAGLGLYFCRLALDTHGGTIAVDSEPELPAVFVVSLPAPA